MTARRLAWITWGATVALSVAGMTLFVAHYPTRLGAGSLPPIAQFALAALALYVGTLGCLLAARRPENPIGWIFAGVGLVFAFHLFSEHYLLHSISSGSRPLPGSVWIAFVAELVGPAAVWAPIISLLLLFPTGRPPSRAWWGVMWLLGIVVVLSITSSLQPQPLLGIEGLEKPVVWDAAIPAAIGDAAWGLNTLCLLLAAVSLIVRAFGSRADERLQLKWIGLSATLVAAGTGGALTSAASFDDAWPTALDVGVPILIAIGLLTLPLTATIAILKYRLYDIDVVVNRTLVYAALTAVLVGAYALGVLVFRTLLDPVTGDNDLAIAASTLAVAALFGPARRRIQAFIDRRFYRSRYDAQQTLEGFAQRLREEVDLNALSAEVVAVIGDTVQPAFAGVWLANRNDFRTIDRYKESHERDW